MSESDLSILTSTVLEVEDAFEVNELYQRNGWTDGLPIVPPTESRVRQFCDSMGLPPGHTIGTEPVRRRRITAEKVAIAAVMAGCLPEYMPVVRAIVEAMCEPQFGLHGSTCSTGGAAPMIIVNGPIRKQIGMNATHNALANGSRANASIGRTVRLMLLNVLGGIPGQLDRATLGHPGKFTFCLAEDEDESQWIPLAQERGIAEGVSAVTVMSVESPHQVMNEWTHNPKELLDTYSAAVRSNMLEYSIWEGNYAMVVAKQHRDIFNAAGWTKQDIREYMFDRCEVRRKQWRDVGKGAIAGLKDEERIYKAMRSPDDLLVISAGGPAGGFGAIAPPWYGKKSLAVTMPVTVV
ncbi:hypothetical protein G3I67_12920 [Orrella sp. NBD-18]|uniref:Thioredoxin n=1 Tax=Sheuella amnicola TaxID=2707330 RepID=A0A6B2R1L4_9BURK|nr:hypothetical protein [Sheuella amnicola]NDY84132.1 hypothetical protein [Sheuella amnicola]HBI82796.1 hypothetical protein [Alcaligenaceae bacterium]